MDLSKGVARGLTNQKSAWLNALYLASLLQWDVLLPVVKSPVFCNDLDSSCYSYDKFEKIPFDLLYNRKRFSADVWDVFGIHVYENTDKLPTGYRMLNEEAHPCPNLCRGTFDSLQETYSQIRGKFIVQGPGISGGIIDSDRHFEGLQLASATLRHSTLIMDRAGKVFNDIRHTKHSKKVAAVHWRYESDMVQKTNATGSPALFSGKVLKSLQGLYASHAHIVIYLVGGGVSHSEINIVTQNFPNAEIIVRSQILPSHKVTFIDAAIDYEVSVMADVFYGHPVSSFSAFIAADRFARYGSESKSFLYPAINEKEVCVPTGEYLAMHWQHEFALPIQRCFVPDPCKTFRDVNSWISSPRFRAMMYLPRFCPYVFGSPRIKLNVDTDCTGTTLLYWKCMMRQEQDIFDTVVPSATAVRLTRSRI